MQLQLLVIRQSGYLGYLILPHLHMHNPSPVCTKFDELNKHLLVYYRLIEVIRH